MLTPMYLNHNQSVVIYNLDKIAFGLSRGHKLIVVLREIFLLKLLHKDNLYGHPMIIFHQ